MNADTLARLTREAEAPEGIAVRVSGPEMKRLLEERAALLEACRAALGGPSASEMMLMAAAAQMTLDEMNAFQPVATEIGKARIAARAAIAKADAP